MNNHAVLSTKTKPSHLLKPATKAAANKKNRTAEKEEMKNLE
jgi:hypothetical protein